MEPVDEAWRSSDEVPGPGRDHQRGDARVPYWPQRWAGLARRAATVGATNSARNLGRKRPVMHSGAPASAVCLIRRRVTLDLDAEVASILEAWAADARVREARSWITRSARWTCARLVARIRERSDVGEDAALR